MSFTTNAAVIREKHADGRTLDGTEYCPYTETSQTYDQRRTNPGLNVVLGSMLLSPWPLEEQTVLDVGCGTGSWLEQLLGKVGAARGIEYNEGMLARASERLQKRPNVEVQQGAAQQLPFQSESFHAVTMNQVIHHFNGGENYSEATEAFSEVYRVLKPGGVFVLNTSSPEQQRDGFWWLSLFPDNSERMMKRFPPIKSIQQSLAAIGFQGCPHTGGTVVPLGHTLMHPSRYLDRGFDLAFDKDYRNCDSSWEMPPEELEAGLQTLRSKIQDGSVHEWLQSREDLRMQTGQYTLLIVRKPFTE